MFKPKTTITGRLENSSGEWIRTTDLRIMSQNPESVPSAHPARRVGICAASSANPGTARQGRCQPT